MICPVNLSGTPRIQVVFSSEQVLSAVNHAQAGVQSFGFDSFPARVRVRIQRPEYGLARRHLRAGELSILISAALYLG